MDGVMEFFDVIFDAFEQARQVPERFSDRGTGYWYSSAPKREPARPVSKSMRGGRT